MISDFDKPYLLRSLFRSGPAPQAIVDFEGRILELNDSLLSVTGQTRATVLSSSFLTLFQSYLTELSTEELEDALVTAMSGKIVRTKLESASETDLNLFIKPILGPGVSALLVELGDESAQSDTVSETLDDLPVGVLKQEADGTLSLYNKAAQRMLGLSREQLVGLTPPSPHLDIRYDDGTPFFEGAWPQNLRSELDEPPINLLLKVERPLHGTRWLLMSTEILEQEGDTQSYAALSTLTDITEQRKQEESLRRGALYDPLTTLPMRALFADRLTQVIGKAQRIPRYCFAVLFIDLDNFDAINGAVGYEAGNDVLIEVAAQLKESLRTADTLARLSDDEFVILLDDAVVLADAVEVAERSLQVLRNCAVEGEALSASIGIVMGNKDCSSPYQALNQARQAMLEAKECGRGCYAIYKK